jgi:putative pyruvate formate lyase activating enzyme
LAAYQALLESGELRRRVGEALSRLACCDLCPRRCEVDRIRGEKGKCRTGRRVVVSSFGPHFGEEASLVGWGGSGTIFFTHCNLRCQFCQNYSISQVGEGEEVGAEDLARMMLRLQAGGCHNINLVSPTHVAAQVLEALELAAEGGLHLPLVYNSGGYDSVETLKLLDGIADIYMPDMKYSDEGTAFKYSGIHNYPEVNRQAVKEMHRQAGDLEVDGRGVAVRGLLVRHLVLPQGLAGTRGVVEFLAQEISPHTYLNVMDQYRPCYRASDYPELSRPITREEFDEAIRLAREAGLERLDGLYTPKAARLLL